MSTFESRRSTAAAFVALTRDRPPEMMTLSAERTTNPRPPCVTIRIGSLNSTLPFTWLITIASRTASDRLIDEPWPNFTAPLLRLLTETAVPASPEIGK